MITAEDIYRIWHKETNLAKGRRVKTVKNFSKAKSKDTWQYFEFCAGFINRNAGHVNEILYIRSLAKYFDGWFDPRFLGTPKVIKIYKDYIKELESHSSKKQIKEAILRSIKTVVQYCKSKELKDLYEYMSDDLYLIPTSLKHLNGGAISVYFLAAVPNILDIFEAYPKDCIDDYIPDFVENYSVYRSRIISKDELNKISENLEYIIEKMIKEKQK